MKPITAYTEQELKALGYEQIKLRDQAISNINAIENELTRRQTEAKSSIEAAAKKPSAERAASETSNY